MLTEIYRANNLQHAHLIRIYLADAGIEAQIYGESLHSAAGELPTGWSTARRTAVNVSHIDDARRLINLTETHRGHSTADTDGAIACLACGKRMAIHEATC